VPRKKVVPGAMSDERVTLQLSVAVGSVQVTAVVQRPASVFWVMSAGVPEMTGSSLSTTVMSKEAVVTLLEVSVAV